jgi:prepilin-type N-terminal cleavage/methylation domain-containing protein/prepilin-type processing-associated H-X9-DG protein
MPENMRHGCRGKDVWMRRGSSKAFTLIELLVVISIIALLLSILMPGLQKAKESAKTLICKTHLKQLGVGLVTYSIDYDNKSLVTSWRKPDGNWDEHLWFLTIAPYMGEDSYYDDPESAMEGGMAVLYCPASKGVDESRVPASGHGAIGTSKNRWRFHNPKFPGEGNYAINFWVGGMDLDMTEDYGWIKSAQQTLSLRDGNSRGDAPAIADAVWMEAIPMDPSQSAGTTKQSLPPYEDDPEYKGGDSDDLGMRRYMIDRHNKAINMVYVDGHAEKVKLEDLWMQRWNKGFNTQKVDVEIARD